MPSLTGTQAIALTLGLCLAGAATPAGPPVTLEPIRFERWKRELAALKGQVVVVDVWATWCPPCIERFPHMVQLYERYKDRGVTFVSMDVDDRDDKQAIEHARNFLKKQNATFRNYLMDENILQSFDMLGVIGIPVVFLYDREGRQRYNLNADDPNRQFTERDVDNALETLLKER